MTRVEKNASVKEELEQMKGSVVAEVREHNRKRRPMLTCSLVMLFFVLCFFAWMAWLIASTGFVRVPLFTSLAYHTPEPLHTVEPGVPVDVFAHEQLTSEVTKRLQAGSGEIEDRTISLTISESSLTATLRSLMEESGLTFLDAHEAQIALSPGSGASLFVPLSNNDLHSAITLEMDVGVLDGKIALTPTLLRVGSLNVPRVFLVRLLDPLIAQEVETLNDELTGYADVTAVQVTEGFVTLTGELSVEIQ